MTELLEPGRVRNAGEGLLFYLLYLLITLLISAGIGGLVGGLFGAGYQTGVFVGNIVAVLFCLGLGMGMLARKGHMGQSGYWGLVVLAGGLALFGGGLLGLIPLAVFSTRENGRVGSYASVEEEGDWQRDTDVPLDKV